MIFLIVILFLYTHNFTNISGWTLSDTSIRAGLECAYVVGRSQFLTSKEADMLGLPGATILLDGGSVPMFVKIFICTLHHEAFDKKQIHLSEPKYPLRLFIRIITYSYFIHFNYYCPSLNIQSTSSWQESNY